MDNQSIELITRMVLESIQKQEASSENGYVVPVGVSARHIHLTQEHVEALFGEGYQLTKKKGLMGGQFASNETVTIVGLKLRAIENVRILGPVRSKSQVEISATDALRLGVKAPIRESGNIAGSAAIAVVGPKGAIYLNEGCIVAKRHIHMAPQDAMAAGVHDGDIVSVKADNERGTTFNNVQIRVDDSFTLEMHIDTDEANAAKIATGDTVRIIKQISYRLQEEKIMLIGKVKGSVVSTRKCERLVGNKFMIVEVLKQHVQTGGADQIIAIDKIGAGIGDYVLVEKYQRKVACHPVYPTISLLLHGSYPQNIADV